MNKVLEGLKFFSGMTALEFVCSKFGSKYKVSKGDLFLCCPFHNDTNPSLSISLGENDWYQCFGCEAKGVASVLFSNVCGISVWKALDLRRMLSKELARGGDKASYVPGTMKEAARFFGWTKEFVREWAVSRRISVRVAQAFEICYSNWWKAIVIPMENKDVLWGIQARGDNGNYWYVKSPSRDALFVRDKVLGGSWEGVFIVESVISVMYLASLGLPAVALRGTRVSEHMSEQLRGIDTKQYVLALDRDDAGLACSKVLEAILCNKWVGCKYDVVMFGYPEGYRDVDDLPWDVFKQAYSEMD